MLSIISYNANVRAEIAGTRKIVTQYRCFSKSKGDYTIKKKKGPLNDDWKIELFDATIERKRQNLTLTDEENETNIDNIVDDGIAELVPYDQEEDDILNLDLDDFEGERNII